jgi:hypothetical protein
MVAPRADRTERRDLPDDLDRALHSDLDVLADVELGERDILRKRQPA